MRKIDTIVVHCSASKDGVAQSRETLVAEHIARGFKTIGYHEVIEPDGSVVVGRPPEEVGAHVEGHNANSIGICMIGTKRFSQAQWNTLKLRVVYWQTKIPNVKVCGHRDFSPDLNHNGTVEPNEWIKLCPNFDVKTWLTDLYVPKKENLA